MKLGTKKMVYIALFISVSIILTRILAFYPIPTVRISFGDIPIMLAGIMFGPIAGAVTGALADISGTLLFPPPTGAAYFPGFTLSKILVGVIPALIYRNSKGSSITRVAVSVIATEIVCSLTLDTLWLSMLYKKGMLVLLPTRIVSRTIITIAEIPVIYTVIERLAKFRTLNNV